MAVSGFLAGLGGAIETMGVFGRYESGRNAGLGFDGITVALLAKTNPILAIPSALLLGMMRAGQTRMAFESKVAPEIIDVILAIILLLVCAPIVVRWVLRLRRRDDARGPGQRAADVRVGVVMSPRTRKLVFALLPVVAVVVAAYAFYYLNSEVKTGAVLNSTFRQSTPLVLAAMCGLLGERTGIVNIGIEGQLLMGAFTGFYVAAATGNIWVGVLAAVAVGDDPRRSSSPCARSRGGWTRSSPARSSTSSSPA